MSKKSKEMDKNAIDFMLDELKEFCKGRSCSYCPLYCLDCNKILGGIATADEIELAHSTMLTATDDYWSERGKPKMM